MYFIRVNDLTEIDLMLDIPVIRGSLFRHLVKGIYFISRNLRHEMKCLISQNNLTKGKIMFVLT